MCGLVGALALEDSQPEITTAYIDRMRDALAHRGPDAAGTWISADRRVGLGHRRLSIIDLSAAASQPMLSDDGMLCLAYNGEIYNHTEIRRTLTGLGHRQWRTDHSDTEVVLRAFEQWGIGCLDRFRGMFAFAMWDGRRRELWLVRDRIGIKPLYYTQVRGRLVFASEIKALLLDTARDARLDEESLYHYLSFLVVPAPRTMFTGISKLPAGSVLRVDATGRISSRRYWNVWEHVEPLSGLSDGDYAERILDELRTSVSLHKASDVPVGVFLSGGVDSSANVSLFAEGGGGAVSSFSVGYDQSYGSYPNELEHAREAAKKAGAVHHVRLLSPADLEEFLPRMPFIQDEPIADPVCFPLYHLARLARDGGVTVCQVGEGADELYCGYEGWRTMLRIATLNRLPGLTPVKKALFSMMGTWGGRESLRYEWLRRGIAGEAVFWGGAEAFTETQKGMLLSPRLRKRFAGYSSWSVISPMREEFLRDAPDRSELNWMTTLDLQLRLPELLLMRVDKMCMASGLEARVPFLDHKFVELALSIPTASKLGGGRLKHLLKLAVKDLVPPGAIDRRKQGFGVPVQEWLAGALGVRARRDLVEFCGRSDLIDVRYVERLFARRNFSAVWYLWNLALWWNGFIDGSRIRPHA